MPSLLRLYREPPPPELGEPFREASGQPPTEQILDKYLHAVGGADRLARLTSFTAKGTYSGFDDADTSVGDIFAGTGSTNDDRTHTSRRQHDDAHRGGRGLPARGAHLPFVYGLSNVTCEAQRESVALAEMIGGVVDSHTSL